MKVFITNIIIATIWLGLSNDPTILRFFTGFIIGFGLIGFSAPLFENGRNYVRRTFAFLRFLWIFLRGFISSNLTIAKAVLLQRKEDIHPNILTLDISDLGRIETVILAQCITLTPGTTTIDISEDMKTLWFHAFDARDPDTTRAAINEKLKKSLLEFTR